MMHQDAGGHLWGYSQGEILQALETNSLPQDVQVLCQQRCSLDLL